MRRGSGFDARNELSVGMKLLRFNWLLAALLSATAAVGFVMLYSVAGGTLDGDTTHGGAKRQILVFAVGFCVMIVTALIDVRFWRMMAAPAYVGAFSLLVLTALIGAEGKGAQRWLDIGGFRVQPSEPMKIASVWALAAYYHWLDPKKISRPLWILPPIILAAAPAGLVLLQPDLGTAMLLIAGAGIVMFLAGVSWWFFAGITASAAAGVWAVLASRGQDWQILKDYQYRRIDTFLEPSSDLRGDGYNINQAQIAIGSGGVDGKGFMQGTQTQGAFLPEAHTDFIFTTLAEEFGLRGGGGLLALYMVIILVSTLAAMRIVSTFGRLLAAGVAATFFLFFAINMAMVMGLTPVVGVPLPLVSYGGTSMLTLMFAFGLLMSAQIHGDDTLERR